MNNSLIPRKNSFFERIKNFFKIKLFKRNKEYLLTEEVNPILGSDNKLDFGSTLRVDISKINNKDYELKQFIKEIETNPNLIYNLSNDRLDRLIKYYEELTKEKQQKIEKLKLSVN